MPYRLKPSEKLHVGLARIAREQAERAAVDLDRAAGGDLQGIHAARARFKKVRAVLRLGKPTLGADFTRENERFRDAARLIAEARHIGAMVEAADALAPAAFKAGQSDELASFRATLARRCATDVRAAARLGDAIAEARAATLEGASAMPGCAWPRDFADVARGLSDTYRRGRKTMRRAFDSGAVVDLHEWRKDVKHHWRQTQILAFLWPSALGARADALKTLSLLLGEDHDFAHLRARARGWGRTRGRGEAARGLAALIEERREEVEDQTRRMGRRLFKEHPTALRKHYKKLWAQAR